MGFPGTRAILALALVASCAKPAGEVKTILTPGLIGRHGEKNLTLVGKPLEVGDKMPAFDVATLEIDDHTGGPRRVASTDLKGPLLISVVPSIDTRVCEAQTGRIAEKEPSIPGVRVLTISRDLPFAQQRFLEENQLKTPIASDFHGGSFGATWGLAVKETGLLARSVWLVDANGVITYREIVEDQATEPNYDPLFQAAAALTK